MTKFLCCMPRGRLYNLFLSKTAVLLAWLFCWDFFFSFGSVFFQFFVTSLFTKNANTAFNWHENKQLDTLQSQRSWVICVVELISITFECVKRLWNGLSWKGSRDSSNFTWSFTVISSGRSLVSQTPLHLLGYTSIIWHDSLISHLQENYWARYKVQYATSLKTCFNVVFRESVFLTTGLR